jgi:hypothetical protein
MGFFSLPAKYPFLACNQDSPRSDLGVDFCFGVGVEKTKFLWKNEKMPEFYEGRAIFILI